MIAIGEAETALNDIQATLGFARLDAQTKRDYIDYRHGIAQAMKEGDGNRLSAILREFSAFHAYALVA